VKASKRSCLFYTRAVKSIPGGVNSPVRAVERWRRPAVHPAGRGAVIVDADGNRYTDYIGSGAP